MTSRGRRRDANGARDDDGFAGRVEQVVAATGAGDVLSYGEVAAEAGRPGAARAVGRILRTTEAALPWWRVVTATGRLVPGAEARQADLLEAEGTAVDRDRGRLATPERRVTPRDRR